jgi:hypothetical protein
MPPFYPHSVFLNFGFQEISNCKNSITHFGVIDFVVDKFSLSFSNDQTCISQNFEMLRGN